MKLGVFGDTHIGRCIPRAIGEVRRKAYRHAFTQAIDIFIEEGIDCLIHLGDVFEKRSMTPEDSIFVKEELQRLVDSIREMYRKDVMMFVVRGNHDGSLESNALDYIKHPLAKYLKVMGDRLLQGEREVEAHNDICLMGVAYHPYISRKFEEVKSIIKEGFSGASGLKILLVHSFIDGYHEIPPGVPRHNYVTVRDFDGLGADIVIAGHYHGRKEPVDENGTVFITPGGAEAVDLSDEGPHGVYILEGKGSIHFVAIKPLHEIRNIKLTSQGTVKPAKWFIDNALKEASSYASNLQARDIEGVLRLVLLGLTDEDPYGIEQALMPGLAKVKEDVPKLLHVELVNRVEDVRQPVTLPALGGGAEFAAEILKPLGNLSQEALKIVEEVGMALDEKASQRTGLLTGSDRAPFINRWIEIFEKLKEDGD